MKRILILVLFTTTQMAFSAECKIIVHIERMTGIKDSHTIDTTAQTKEECQKKAAPHRHNFYPKEVKAKSVEVIFEGNK